MSFRLNTDKSGVNKISIKRAVRERRPNHNNRRRIKSRMLRGSHRREFGRK